VGGEGKGGRGAAKRDGVRERVGERWRGEK